MKKEKNKKIKIKHLKQMLIEKFYSHLLHSENSISGIDIELMKILFK